MRKQIAIRSGLRSAIASGVIAALALVSPLFAADCPVTRPPNPPFIPAEPSNPNAGIPGASVGREFAYGTDALWTLLEDTGIWHTLRQKVWMWSQGFNPRAEQKPELVITGRRLDGNSPPFRYSGNTYGTFGDGTSAMLRGIDVPANGCWEITSRYGANSLSFVVLVEP